MLMAALTLPHSLFADELFDYGRYWANLPAPSRTLYIEGVAEGAARAYLAAQAMWLPFSEVMQKPESARIASVRKQVFLMISNNNQIAAVMLDLYRDPANTFIDNLSMLYIARDKLLGENIENQLTAARKQAIDRHNLNETMRQQK